MEESSFIDLEAVSLSEETIQLLKDRTGFLITGRPGFGSGYERKLSMIRARMVARHFSRNHSSYGLASQRGRTLK